jgi:invasion protein IalB
MPVSTVRRHLKAGETWKPAFQDVMDLFKALSKRRVLAFAIFVALTAVLALVDGAHTPAGVQFSQSELKTTVGAWQVRCGRPPGARAEKCALVQSVKAEDRRNVSLTIIFLRSFSGDKRLLRVVAPLGVLLPTGLGLKIDGEDVGHAPFLKCGQVGCVAEVVADDNLIEKMQSGQNAIFIIFQTPEEGIGVPIDLTGFGDGLAQLN